MIVERSFKWYERVGKDQSVRSKSYFNQNKGFSVEKNQVLYRDYIDFQIHEIFPETVANPINKQVRSTSLFIGFASLEGNISSI